MIEVDTRVIVRAGGDHHGCEGVVKDKLHHWGIGRKMTVKVSLDCFEHDLAFYETELETVQP